MTFSDIGVQRRGNGHVPSGVFERFDRFMRAPQLTIRRPGKPAMTIVADRVRARPALTPTLAGTLGLMGLGIGLVELLAPRGVARFFGMSERASPLIRAYGLRELAGGVALFSDPTKAGWLWARAAGDVMDYATLRAAARPDNPRLGRVQAAIGFVVLAGVLDMVAGARMSNVQRNCGGERRR